MVSHLMSLEMKLISKRTAENNGEFGNYLRPVWNDIFELPVQIKTFTDENSPTNHTIHIILMITFTIIRQIRKKNKVLYYL